MHVLGILIFFFFQLAYAEEYQLLRQNEDWSYLRDRGKRSDYLDSIKFIPHNQDQTRYLTVGGEVRERYEYFSNFLWGRPPFKGDGYILSRIMLHGDFHLSERLRFFLQLKSGLVFGKEQPLRGSDKDELDVHQFFFDYKLAAFTVRAGRHELNYGSGRLVSVREGPNVRQSFDGLKLTYQDPRMRIDGLLTRAVETNPGDFDDGDSEERSLYGVYATLKRSELYYLGFDKDDAEFFESTGHEERHSFGARFFSSETALDYDNELVYQIGRFDGNNIKAWTISTGTGYTWKEALYTPRLGLKASVASGDHNFQDGTLGTFNPLFPKGAYFNEAAIIGPANIIDIHPSLTVNPKERLKFIVDWDFLWRHSLHDGLYNTPMDLLVPGDQSDARYIGSQLALSGEIKFGRHWLLYAQYMHFYTGRFLKESTPGKDIDYFTGWVTYKF